jgi:hypothetical protein
MVEGVVHNRKIMPTRYGNPEAEYWRIVNGVSQWDVGVERQVQLKGKAAAGKRADQPGAAGAPRCRPQYLRCHGAFLTEAGCRRHSGPRPPYRTALGRPEDQCLVRPYNRRLARVVSRCETIERNS